MRGLPELAVNRKSQIMTTTFSGYNHNEIIEDGEMYDMQNLSGDLYPMLTQRKKRGIASYDADGNVPVPLTGIHGRDQLVFVRGSKVYYNFQEISGVTLSTEESLCPKQIVSFGAYVCIFPDKQYFNTADLTEAGSMERRFSASGEDVSLTMCRGDGTDYDMEQIIVSADAPEDPENGQLWIDQSGSNDVLRQWMSSVAEWIEVATTFVKIEGSGLGAGLKMYDVVDIDGLKAPEVENPDETTERIAEQVDALNGSSIVYFAGENYIVVAGLLTNTQAALAAETVTVNRTVPDMDFVCESNNRLWGCKYGLHNGETVNEIYASALGDLKNWNRYMGNSQDSYTASVGTDGPWTGAITQRGYPVFFKEGYIHRVSGTTPSSFSINTTVCRGVQRGSWRSVCVVNEAIYYKSRQDVMVYDGNMPVSISENLGKSLNFDARAGVLGGKYYISMKDQRENWTLFVYDTEKGLWFKEDATHALGFASVADELYFIDEEHNTLVSVTGSMAEDAGYAAAGNRVEDDLEWSATFGLTGAEYGRGSFGGRTRTDIGQKRYMSKFTLRIYVEPGSTVQMEIKYENGDWEKVGEITGDRLDSYIIPIIPRRCDHLRFRLSGKGESRIYSIFREMEVAGDG